MQLDAAQRGCVGNGVVDDRAQLNTLANSTAPSSGAELLFRGSGKIFRIASSLTIPSNVTVRVEKGAKIQIDSGATLTINGPLITGVYQAFQGSGTVSLALSSVSEVLPQWWGATGNGVTDDATAINAAIAASAAGATIRFLPGTYIVGTRILMKSARTYLGSLWEGTSGTTIKCKASTTLAAMFYSEAYELNYAGAGGAVVIRNLVFDGNKASSGAGHAIWLFNYNSIIEDCRFKKLAGDAIHFEGGAAFQGGSNTCVETWIERCFLYECTGSFLKVVDASGNKITDGYVRDCIIGGTSGDRVGEDAISIASASGWKISGNHFYQLSKSAIVLSGCNHADVSHNYIESYGREAAGGSYYGISAQGLLSSSGSTPVVIVGNRIFNGQGSGGTRHGIYVRSNNSQTNAHCIVGMNHIRGSGGQIGIGIANGTGGALLKGAVVGNTTDNCGTDITFGDGARVKVEGNSFNYAAAAPSGNYWPAGSHVFNSAPVAGGSIGWVCITQGAPSTWQEFGQPAGVTTQIQQDGFSPSATTTSSTYGTPTGFSAGTYSQGSANQPLIAWISGSVFATAVPTAVKFRLVYDGVAVAQERQVYLNAANSHTHFSFPILFTGAATAGSKSVTVEWKRQTGSGTVTADTNDPLIVVIRPQ